MAVKKVSPPLPGKYTVLAFYGPAGTGKSMRSQMVASKKKIDMIIDDGLVISRGRILAGKSAKTEPNMVRAIRRAMVHFEDHREEVRRCIARFPGARVMVLATSKGMSDDICAILGLPEPSEYIHIEQVASDDEIEKALYERKQNKRHVIPVAQTQIQKNYTGRLVGRLKNLFSSREETEKTIVRPPFSYYGALKIEPEVVEQIAEYVAKSTPQVISAKEPRVKQEHDRLVIVLSLTVKTGALNFKELTRQTALRVRVAVEQLTGMEVARVDVTIAEVTFDD
ncbi:MAG: Asp23/Gls24 family envelope stress response protein [Pyramidobacter sp.]|nr:Asp23/Gls24 family envelope stress response protein [Pyramidobacter sp.]